MLHRIHTHRAHAASAYPQEPIPKSLASPGLLAHIAVGKFVDALPLYRQHRQITRLGVTLSPTTFASWMVRAGALVQPLINLLRETMLAQSYVMMDETTVQVLDEAGKAASSKSYLWAQRTGGDHPIILFDYDPSRSAEVPLRLLDGFSGALHTDGYRGYDRPAEAFSLTRLYCFAHARRKFVEVLKAAGINPNKIPAKPPPEVRQALKAIGFIKSCISSSGASKTNRQMNAIDSAKRTLSPYWISCASGSMRSSNTYCPAAIRVRHSLTCTTTGTDSFAIATTGAIT